MAEEVFTGIGAQLSTIYSAALNALPTWMQNFLSLFLIIILIVIYSIIVWHGYRFISKKDPLGLNLMQYSGQNENFFSKLLKGIFYFIEYLIISPLIIFIAFGVFTFLLTLLNETLTVQGILLVSAAIIGAVRLTAYYKEDLSKEVAKFLPFTLLAVSVLNPKFFDLTRIFSELSKITSLIDQIGIYLIFIILLEIILRFFDFIFSLFGVGEVDETAENVKNQA